MNRTVLLVCLWAAAQAAQAATTCRIVTVGSIGFGNYDVLATTPNDTLLGVTVACDRSGGPANVTVTVGLGAGANGSSVDARRMLQTSAPGDYLSYGLFRDVGRSSVWGNSNGINTVSRTLSVPNNGSASTTFTVYGRIPAQQNVAAGEYRDTVQITVSP